MAQKGAWFVYEVERNGEVFVVTLTLYGNPLGVERRTTTPKDKPALRSHWHRSPFFTAPAGWIAELIRRAQTAHAEAGQVTSEIAREEAA